MSYRVCIDIGGTFTDCVVADARGSLAIYKSPSTPPAFEQGFMNVLGMAAAAAGLPLTDFLGQVERIVHGTTVATNALVEGRLARVGLICNHGFRDILTLREAPRKPPFRWKLDYPEPFVPRSRTRGVRGRIDAQGAERAPLDEDDVRAAVVDFRKLEVDAIAVCLLWSIVDGRHEQRVRAIVHELWPEVPITLSHELNPIPREYRRAIASAVDAALHPVVSAYVGALERALRDAGYRHQLLIANCLGGMMPPEAIAAKPIYSVMSGPTLAPIAATRLADARDLVVVDMGGTSFDVSAVRDGRLIVSSEAMISEFEMLGIPKIDVRSVGAGGGSIAWVDPGGLLRVGPRSAGARPGPACYGLGGTEATVTDANVVLGIIDPDYFLGGAMRLDRAAAERAVGRIAAAIGVDLAEAAQAIHSTVNHNMIAAIEDITVNEGLDPRESYFVAGGGATAIHIGEMARVLGIKGYMVPKFSAGLSAFGGLISDIVWEENATLVTDARRFDLDGVNRVLADLRARGEAFLERAGVPVSRREFAYVYLGRYQYQSWELEVPFEVDATGGLAPGEERRLADDFHRMHQRVHTIKNEADLVEFSAWRVRAIGRVTTTLPSGAIESADTPRLKGRRAVYLDERRSHIDLPVYDGTTMPRGAVVAGPAIIEEATTTILLPAASAAQTDAGGNYRVEF